MLGLGTPIKLRTAEAAFDEIRQHVAGYDLSMRLCWRAARLSAALPNVEPSYDVPVALFSLHKIISLQAALWAATVPSSLPPTRQKISRGVPHPAPSPGGIASQNRRSAVYRYDGFAYLTWFERKVVAHIQSRWGPYYVGAHGLLQPLADGVKFLFKEDLTPPESDKFAYFLAPFLALALALTAIALIPFGPPIVSPSRSTGFYRFRIRHRVAVPFRRSLLWAFMASPWPDGPRTANIRFWAAFAAPLRWSATKFL